MGEIVATKFARMQPPPMPAAKRTKDALIKIRVLAEEKTRYSAEARRLGVKLSAWFRMLADRATGKRGH
jgi:hypothetical protein